MAFVRFNTRRGKPKPITIRALLDSGGSETIVTSEVAKNLKIKTLQSGSTVFTTPGGKLVTNQQVKSQFTIPELHPDKLIEWNVHVASDLGAYDMIIGRDILSFLGIDVKFSTLEIEWEHRTMPFKMHDATVLDAYHVEEPGAVDEQVDRVKKILDAKCEPADLEKVCTLQSHLIVEQQQALLSLLNRYADLFDGTLGKWNGTEVNLKLQTRCYSLSCSTVSYAQGTS